MQRPAKPFTPVRFRLQPPNFIKAGIIGFDNLDSIKHRFDFINILSEDKGIGDSHIRAKYN